MANVANCKKCGALFLQTSRRDICDKCFEEQNKLLSDINKFVISSPEETIPLDDLLKKFNLPKEGSLRTLIKITKVNETPSIYPRNYDKIIKKPLK